MTLAKKYATFFIYFPFFAGLFHVRNISNIEYKYTAFFAIIQTKESEFLF